MAGSARNARAAATRCRSPADRRCPVRPPRSRGPEGGRRRTVERRAPHRVGHFGVGGLRPRVADVLGDGRMEDARILLDQADRPPHIGEPDASADRGRRCGPTPRSGSSSAQQQVGERGLAAAARADDRQRLAASIAERDVVEHRAAAIVGQRHVIEGHVAVDARSSASALGCSTTSTGSSRICATRRSDTRIGRQAGVHAHAAPAAATAAASGRP